MAAPLLRSQTGREVLFEQIVQVLNSMPEDLRDIFVALHYEGKSRTQLAAELGLSSEEISRRCQRANQHFYRLIRSHS